MDESVVMAVNDIGGGRRRRPLSWWSSWRRAVERACEGKRKTMAVSSDWWVLLVIYQTGMGIGLAGSWAATQVSVLLFFSTISFFSFISYFLF
jgi:hypothetical protein